MTAESVSHAHSMAGRGGSSEAMCFRSEVLISCRLCLACSILADLPRSLSEVHLQQHGPLSPTMDGPVKFDS